MDNILSFSEWRREHAAELPPKGSYTFLVFAAAVLIGFYAALVLNY